MAQKMLFCFTHISSKILLQILGYSFLPKVQYFGKILSNGVYIESVKNCLRKSCSALEPQILGEIDQTQLPYFVEYSVHFYTWKMMLKYFFALYMEGS
jgi:hypothetical protein